MTMGGDHIIVYKLGSFLKVEDLGGGFSYMQGYLVIR